MFASSYVSGDYYSVIQLMPDSRILLNATLPVGNKERRGQVLYRPHHPPPMAHEHWLQRWRVLRTLDPRRNHG
jgi:hypothetical protein